MPAYGVILDEEHKQKAIANNLSLQTVYARLKRGWDVERAVTEKPKQTTVHDLPRSETGELLPHELPKGKQRSIRLYKHMDDDIDEAIASSGMTQSDFVSMAVEQFYKKLWKKPTRSRTRRTLKQ